MSIGSNIRRLRESRGMTQKELGAVSGVTDKAVSTWEMDIKVPRMAVIQRLADYFGISKSELLDDRPSTFVQSRKWMYGAQEKAPKSAKKGEENTNRDSRHRDSRQNVGALNNDFGQSYAEQVMRNCQEDYGFAEILNKFKRKEYAHMATIRICQTPLALALVGADISLDLVINPSTLVKCMSSPDRKYHGHALDVDVLKYLVFELRNPAMIFKGTKEGSFVFVTDLKDRQGRPIIVITALNRLSGHHPVNQVTSAYGRERFVQYAERQIKNGNLVAVNKNKANQLFQSSGHDWPIEEILISFDNSIAYTLENVKGLFEKNLNMSAIDPDFSRNTNAEDEKRTGTEKVFDEQEKIMDMIRFFEYAGSDIYNSLLWHQFQQDKEFLNDSDVVTKVQDVLSNAQKSIERDISKAKGAAERDFIIS